MKKIDELGTFTPADDAYVYLMSNDGSAEGKAQLSEITEIPLRANKTVTFNDTQTASEIQAIIDSQPRYIPENIGLTFQFSDGTYDLDNQLVFDGFYGGGAMYIYGNTGESASRHTNQAVHLDFTGSGTHGVHVLKNRLAVAFIQFLKVTVDDGYSAIITQRFTYYFIRYNYCINNGKTSSESNGAYVIWGVSTVEENYFSNNYNAIKASVGAKIDAHDNDDTGTQPNYGNTASSNGKIGKSGVGPAGSIANDLEFAGGEVIT